MEDAAAEQAAQHPDFHVSEPGHTLAAVSVRATAAADLVEILVRLRAVGAEVVTVNSFPATRGEPDVTRVFDIELRDCDPEVAAKTAASVPGVVVADARPTLGQIFGKRVIVIGGGAQVAQVTLGAVTESDRHNLRGERISVDTIALVGEAEIAAAVRELQAVGIPVVSLNMVGSVSGAADLVVSDPVQAGTMAVMHIANTARFTIDRQRGRRY